jgi:hypothetical protein
MSPTGGIIVGRAWRSSTSGSVPSHQLSKLLCKTPGDQEENGERTLDEMEVAPGIQFVASATDANISR